MGEYIIAHDVGTGGSKAVLVDTSGKVMGKSFRPYPVYYPRPDWAEQEPEDWWTAIAQSTQELLAHTGVSPHEIIALTFSTQMLGIVPMDAQGCPLRRPIIWLDNRATRQAQRMMRKFLSPALFALIAGAPLGGKDGMPKLLWLKEHEPQLYRDMFCFLDVNGYLLYRSTGRMVMELSGASVFGLDLKKKTWLAGLMGYVGLDPKKLPPLVRSTEVVPLPTLQVVGGGAKSRLWMQILADITGRRVEVTADPQEAGARGVALIAAIGLGIYPGFEALKPIISIAATYEPRSENRPTYDFLFQNYKASYRYLKKFYRQINQPRFAAAPPGPVVTPAGPPGAMMDSAPPST